MLIIRGFLVDIIGDVYEWILKIEENGYGHDLDMLIFLH